MKLSDNPKKCREIILLGQNDIISKSRSWAGDRFFPVRKQQGRKKIKKCRLSIPLYSQMRVLSKSCLWEVITSSGIPQFACGRPSTLPAERTAGSCWCKYLALGCWTEALITTNFKLDTIIPVCWEGNLLHWESPQILSKLWMKYRYLVFCDYVTCFINLTKIWRTTEAEFSAEELGEGQHHPCPPAVECPTLGNACAWIA